MGCDCKFDVSLSRQRTNLPALQKELGIPLLVEDESINEDNYIDTITYKKLVNEKACCVRKEYASQIRSHRHFKTDGLRASLSWSKDGNRILVSPYLVKDSARDTTEDYVYININGDEKLYDDSNVFPLQDSLFHFNLKDRQTIKVKFSQWTLTAITLPVQYRSVKPNWPDGARTKFDSFPSKWSGTLSIGLAAGYTIGATRFKRIIGNNQTRNRSLTIGPSLSISDQKFKGLGNADDNGKPIPVDRTTISITPGIALLLGIDRFNIAISGGYSWVPQYSDDWAHQGQFHLGIGAGISLFSLDSK